jgi:hypothetical protein
VRGGCLPFRVTTLRTSYYPVCLPLPTLAAPTLAARSHHFGGHLFGTSDSFQVLGSAVEANVLAPMMNTWAVARCAKLNHSGNLTTCRPVKSAVPIQRPAGCRYWHGSRKGAVRKRSQRQTKLMATKRRTKNQWRVLGQKRPGAKKSKGVRSEA